MVVSLQEGLGGSEMVILSGGSGAVNKITFLRSPPEKANQRDLGA